MELGGLPKEFDENDGLGSASKFLTYPHQYPRQIKRRSWFWRVFKLDIEKNDNYTTWWDKFDHLANPLLLLTGTYGPLP